MADGKISGLPASTVPLAGTEVLPIVQSGVTKKVSVADLTAGRTVTAATFSGAGTSLTGTASGLTAGNVTTNANLTGAITSVGNATSLGSFTSANLAGALTDETGTGSAVFATSPTLVTPALGTPSALVGTNITGTANSLNAGIGVNQTWQAPSRAIGTT